VTGKRTTENGGGNLSVERVPSYKYHGRSVIGLELSQHGRPFQVHNLIRNYYFGRKKNERRRGCILPSGKKEDTRFLT